MLHSRQSTTQICYSTTPRPPKPVTANLSLLDAEQRHAWLNQPIEYYQNALQQLEQRHHLQQQQVQLSKTIEQLTQQQQQVQENLAIFTTATCRENPTTAADFKTAGSELARSN